jgi:methionine-S-sulfoxide reductase
MRNVVTRTVLLATMPLGVLALTLWSIAGQNHAKPTSKAMNEQAVSQSNSLQKATFGSGCFWCTEAVFRELKGVHSVVSGYSGGRLKNPSYEQVCTGATGHAESIQITYDPQVISYEELLEVFWRTHDPTTLNRQGNDVGTQYRSVVFYHNDSQRQLAERYKQKLDASGAFSAPIVTEISPFEVFYPAEDYHQQYFELHGRQPYCQLVIRPKLEKFRKVFHDKLQAEAKSNK